MITALTAIKTFIQHFSSIELHLSTHFILPNKPDPSSILIIKPHKVILIGSNPFKSKDSPLIFRRNRIIYCLNRFKRLMTRRRRLIRKHLPSWLLIGSIIWFKIIRRTKTNFLSRKLDKWYQKRYNFESVFDSLISGNL